MADTRRFTITMIPREDSDRAAWVNLSLQGLAAAYSDAEPDYSVSPQLSAADRVELQRRLAAHQADPSTSIPWEEVRASLFKRKD